MSAPRIFTLLVQGGSARLLDATGGLLADTPDAIRRALPSGARVQLVLAGPRLTVQCLEVPSLTPRDRRDVLRRVTAEAGLEGQLTAQVLDADPHQEGGHVLWVAAQPREELDPWLDLVQEAGARPVFATPWQRAILAALDEPHPSALGLALEAGTARVLFLRGRSLRFTRTFALPAHLDPGDPSPEGTAELAHIVAEELSLILQFIQQKHRGRPPRALLIAGLPPSRASALDAAALALGLAVSHVATDVPALVAAGADRERRRKGLDLLPGEIRDALRRSLARTVVRLAVAGMILLGVGAKAFLMHHVASLTREAVQAEAAMEKRRALFREGEEAARVRFGLLRVRRAEERQKAAAEHLERLGVRIFQVPKGLELHKVEVRQEPGTHPSSRFSLEGAAHTGQGFSLGLLADYYDHLAALPGLRLEPLKDVVVTDSPGQEGPEERALTRFRMGGTAP